MPEVFGRSECFGREASDFAKRRLAGRGERASSVWRSGLGSRNATRMRQSLDEFERAFVEKTYEDRARRDSLRRRAAMRSRQRDLQRVHKRGTARFIILVLALIATAAIVTIAMFQTLYVVMG